MQAQLLNPAGAALVRHIKWLRALFFKMEKKWGVRKRHVNDKRNPAVSS